MMRKAVYPGSFDPITNGHLEVLRRSLEVFDEVHLLLAVNPKKSGTFTIEERLETMKEAVKDMPNVHVDYYEGLTVEFCKKVGAKHIIRGLRAVTDFEYEFQLAAANEFAAPDIDMVFFMARKDENFVSSSSVNELRKGGVDVSSLVPSCVIETYEKKGM
ncbi:MAG: pantetheine-phosphate adenylyltransferase [Bacilli bacterium]|nr:pantetheine-phosphate adenylyltransferase [Bacilli bacterium]